MFTRKWAGTPRSTPPAVAPPTGLELPAVLPLQAEECDQDPPEMHKTAGGLSCKAHQERARLAENVNVTSEPHSNHIMSLCWPRVSLISLLNLLGTLKLHFFRFSLASAERQREARQGTRGSATHNNVSPNLWSVASEVFTLVPSSEDGSGKESQAGVDPLTCRNRLLLAVGFFLETRQCRFQIFPSVSSTSRLEPQRAARLFETDFQGESC